MIRRHDSIIVQQVSRLLVPFTQVFAIYVLLHGHYSPGGGFQAGVLIAASLIFEILVGTRYELKRFSIRREFILASFGVFIFLGIGALALAYGGSFFDYGEILVLGELEPTRRYWSILIAEIGITLAVAMTLVVIFNILAFLPESREGSQ